jgi:hypothetical protein
MTFGSYFGDWDSQDNFLRAALANPGDILTNCWAGRPNWFFHYLTLGESFSEAVSISQNNFFLYTPLNYGYNGVHTGFMGDVSLRQDYFYPCNNLTSSAISNNSKVQLNWAASAASGVLGYYLYRAKSINDTFVLVSPNKISALTYTDSFPLVGTNVYQVRAVRLENTATGSYYNLSLGKLDSIQNMTPVAIPNIAPLQAAVYPNPIKSNGTLHLTLNQFTSGSMTLLNTLAQVQLQQNFSNSKQLSIGLPNLAAGVYFLQLQTKSGILLKKIIISD